MTGNTHSLDPKLCCRHVSTRRVLAAGAFGFSWEKFEDETNFLEGSRYSEIRYCQSCGLLMEHFTATFFFEGSTAQLKVPFCPNCEGISPPTEKGADRTNRRARLNRAPLKFLVFDFALTAPNIGPSGQETYRRPELMWVFAELPFKARQLKATPLPLSLQNYWFKC